MEWIRAPITGKLDEVPGLGPANIAHLSSVNEATRWFEICYNPTLLYLLLNLHKISHNTSI